MQILMIEDEPRVADFVRRGLRTEGWTVETVPSAEEGLNLLTAGQYDLVLLDVLLPVCRARIFAGTCGRSATTSPS